MSSLRPEEGENRPRPLAADPYLAMYADRIAARRDAAEALAARLTGKRDGLAALADWAQAHHHYGLHREGTEWVFRDWAPNVHAAWLIGDFSDWRRRREWRLTRVNAHGDWELRCPDGALRDGMHYLVDFEWAGGSGSRVPAYARYVVQDEASKQFSARVYAPEHAYCFQHVSPPAGEPVLIYESHVGMATEQEKVGSFREYREQMLPRIAASGYNTVQLMAVMGHPYYGSFGYHVANFFAASARFGTPDEFKELVDAAHGLGLRVIIDLVHSHAVKNEREGLGCYDGTRHQFFHAGAKGEHTAWDSLCFDYSKPEVLYFLLSNCRYWLEEFQLDGFRFDGVTSMLYTHHGLGKSFNGYTDYFGPEADEEAYLYLALANTVIHTVRPEAVTVAEDVSGMVGLAAPAGEGGCGFDYRLAMGVTDYWFKLFDIPDEFWNLGMLWHELTNHRPDERTISYVECHDQAIVGGQTALFRMIGGAMYDAMSTSTPNLAVDRGVALHKMARLVTAATAANGYLTFMGNEFGHPEWVDFPREGNGWSYRYARRQWSLAERDDLRYHALGEFDRAMLRLLQEGIFAHLPQLVHIDEMANVLVFERGDCWFFANFHPIRSLPDFDCVALPGKYELALDSDALEFNGFGRVAPGQCLEAAAVINGNTLSHRLRLYLPNRTVLVLRRLG